MASQPPPRCDIVHELAGEDARAALLGDRRHMFLVLFYRASHSESLGARWIWTQEPVIAGFLHATVDLDDAPDLQERFRLAKVPMLAAIFDGSLLGLVDQPGPGCGPALAALARKQRTLLDMLL